ncbi:MAG TPA: hypothetical protein VGN15_13475 [Ktedonobacteraceae bacterium]|jgi:hypothetical protein|nr:hypothetical protein [Ktedonobacteraceae bacterium]
MPDASHHDLLLSATGDLVPNWSGGLVEATDIQADYQDVNFRVLTTNPDVVLWPLGADLELLGGKPNIQATAKLGEDSIRRALTYDGRFTPSELSITAVPLGKNQIQFFIGINNLRQVATTAPYYTAVVNLPG